MKSILLDRIYIPKNLIIKDSIPEAEFTYIIEEFGGMVPYKTYSHSSNYLIVPSGSWNKVSRYLTSQEIEDKRSDKFTDIPEFTGTLWPDQVKVVDEFFQIPTKSGFIHSRAGSGKTVMACALIAKLKQKFLVIVPTSLLLEQWKDRLEHYIPNIKVARLGQGYDEYTDNYHGLIAIINTIRNKEQIEKYRDEFGLIIMDEAHRLPAATYQATINKLAAMHKVGLSANMTRKDNKHVMIEDFLGPYKVYNGQPNVYQATIKIVDARQPFVYMPGMQWTKVLNQICYCEEFNQLIARIVLNDVSIGRKVAVLTPRLNQIEELVTLLDGIDIGVITGEVKQKERNKIIEKINNGELDVLLCSKQIFEEGTDIQRLDTVHLVAPSNNLEKLEQQIGRVERHHPDKLPPLVYDYWFMAPTKNTFHKQQNIRHEFYLEKGYVVEVL